MEAREQKNEKRNPRRFRVALAVCVMVALLFASWLLRGQLTILRLERLLDRDPSVAEVADFLERNSVPHSVNAEERRISALVNTCPIPFDTSRIYRIRFDERRQVTGYESHSESTGP